MIITGNSEIIKIIALIIIGIVIGVIPFLVAFVQLERFTASGVRRYLKIGFGVVFAILGVLCFVGALMLDVEEIIIWIPLLGIGIGLIISCLLIFDPPKPDNVC